MFLTLTLKRNCGIPVLFKCSTVPPSSKPNYFFQVKTKATDFGGDCWVMDAGNVPAVCAVVLQYVGSCAESGQCL